MLIEGLTKPHHPKPVRPELVEACPELAEWGLPGHSQWNCEEVVRQACPEFVERLATNGLRLTVWPILMKD